MMLILGISAYYHDSAACLLENGNLIAAAQEERFSRIKHDQRFPAQAIRYCLAERDVSLGDIDSVVFYEKPFRKFERLLETYLGFAPCGLTSFLEAMPTWIQDKLFMKSTLAEELNANFGEQPRQILFSDHHQSHAASAFFPSPYSEAAVLCLDGVGEWSTTTGWIGTGNQLTQIWEIEFPHSLGLLYSAFTAYTGFKVNSGEYKVMGLAPYGKPVYVDTIYKHLMDLKEDGSFRINLDYFEYCTGLTMTNKRFHDLFGGPPRKPETPLSQKEMDLARSIQEVAEEVILRLGRSLHNETGLSSLCMAGGVALNCVANGRLMREGPFKEIWIQPAAGDAGGALGAALAAWHKHLKAPRQVQLEDQMKGCFLGPSFTPQAVESFLQQNNLPFQKLGENEVLSRTARDLADGKVVGWFQGRMEFGPRALGARSILGDARSPKMQSVMNQKIKFRESFRPFAPAVLKERVSEYFEIDRESPFMLLTAPVRKERRKLVSNDDSKRWGIDLLNVPRSDIPAVTHIDFSARVQTVSADTNPLFHSLLKHFEAQTNEGVVVNTSFNVRGEPIVCSPEDAYRCFMRTEIDTLVLENCVLDKSAQPQWQEKADWQSTFTLD
ncbi:MAG: carbamoyltransferase [Candidatus Riflebacteria bacterium]|nr:carbamoyltransferase [Candidatus Riflebacteria bacterium]